MLLHINPLRHQFDIRLYIYESNDVRDLALTMFRVQKAHDDPKTNVKTISDFIDVNMYDDGGISCFERDAFNATGANVIKYIEQAKGLERTYQEQAYLEPLEGTIQPLDYVIGYVKDDFTMLANGIAHVMWHYYEEYRIVVTAMILDHITVGEKQRLAQLLVNLGYPNRLRVITEEIQAMIMAEDSAVISRELNMDVLKKRCGVDSFHKLLLEMFEKLADVEKSAILKYAREIILGA